MCLNDVTITLSNVTVTNNTAQEGGGVYIGGYAMHTNDIEIVDSEISDNESNGNGGGLLISGLFNGQVKIGDIGETVEIINNESAGDGGGIYIICNNADLMLLETAINSNTANGSGGGAYVCCSSPFILNSEISWNTSLSQGIDGGGGLFYFLGNYNNPQIDLCRIEYNTSRNNGGGIFTKNGYNNDESNSVLNVSNTDISNNYAENYGGGAYLESAINIFNQVIVSADTARSGGGVYANSSYFGTSGTYENHTTIRENIAQYKGAGIYSTKSKVGNPLLFLDFTDVVENKIDSGMDPNEPSQGGGIFCNVTKLNINRSNISDNSIVDASNSEPVYAPEGGGLYQLFCGNTRINNTIFSYNIGGGIYLNGVAEDGWTESTMRNVLIHHNIADSASALSATPPDPPINIASIKLENCTVTDNINLDQGATSYIESGCEFVGESSIFWNTDESNINYEIDANGGIADLYYCDVNGGANGILNSQGVFENSFNLDPVFMQDEDFQYYFLDCDSPCFDSGNPDGNVSGNNWNTGQDEGDEEDPDGSRIDMGAYGGPDVCDWFEECIYDCMDSFAHGDEFGEGAYNADANMNACNCECGSPGGNVHNDEQINILDIVTLINIILNNTSISDCHFSEGDLDEDGELDILDIVTLVNLILGTRDTHPNDLVTFSCLIQEINQDSIYMDFYVANETCVEGVQIELDLSGWGYSFNSIQAGDYIGAMDLAHAVTPDSSDLRFLVYDTDGNVLSENDRGLLTRIWLAELDSTNSIDSTMFTERLFVNTAENVQYLPNRYLDYSGFQQYVCEMDSTYCTGCKDALALNYDLISVYGNADECVYLLGDMDDSGVLDILDVVILNNIVLGNIFPDEYQLFAGDINGDGTINILDTMALLDLIAMQRSDGDGGDGEILISKVINDSGNQEGETASMTVNMLNEMDVRVLHLSIDLEIDMTFSSITNGTRTEEMNLQYHVNPDSTEVSFILYSAGGYSIEPGIGSILEIGLNNPLLSRNSDPDDGNFTLGQFANCPDSILSYTVISSDEMARLIAQNSVSLDIPLEFSIHPAYPNPFNPITTIQYDLPNDSKVGISVYDIMGHKVQTLFNGEKPAGYFTVRWDASEYSSGIYFITVSTAAWSESCKVLLIK